MHSSAVLRSEAICTMTNKAMTLKDHPLPLRGFLVYLCQHFAQTCAWFELKTVPCCEWESWLCDVILFHPSPLVKVPAAIKNQIKFCLQTHAQSTTTIKASHQTTGKGYTTVRSRSIRRKHYISLRAFLQISLQFYAGVYRDHLSASPIEFAYLFPKLSHLNHGKVF